MKLPLAKALTGEGDSLRTGILAVAALGLLAAGALALQWRRYASYRDSLEPGRRALAAIAAAANQIKGLDDEVREDDKLGRDDVTYITQQATASSFGDVNPKQGTKSPAKGYKDTIFTITASEKDRNYYRQQLATFFYRIEAMRSRMRVTAISMRLADKKKPEDDLWRFTAEFTSRTREGD
ncbi:MAG: hypothetical protein ACREIU_01635 [Planctomycetota bacterium]